MAKENSDSKSKKPAVKSEHAPDAKKKKESKPSKGAAIWKSIVAIPKRIQKAIMNTVSELKKVSWPSRKDLINYTTVVVVFMVVMAIIIGVLDLGMSAIIALIVRG